MGDEVEIWQYWGVCKIQDWTSLRELSVIKKLSVGKETEWTFVKNTKRIVTIKKFKRLLHAVVT